MKAHKKDVHENAGPVKSMRAANPFIKLIEDKERIARAIRNDEPLSSLKDIKFVRPL